MREMTRRRKKDERGHSSRKHGGISDCVLLFLALAKFKAGRIPQSVAGKLRETIDGNTKSIEELFAIVQELAKRIGNKLYILQNTLSMIIID